MKKLLFILWIYLLISSVGYAQSVNRFRDQQTIDQFFRYRPNRLLPILLAHRGAPGSDDTENSITTFDKTARQLPDALLEMDVRFTRDSALVLLHDATLDRESDGTGPVANKTLSELKTVRLRTLAGTLTHQLIPLFNDVVRWNKNRYVLVLDVKPGTDPVYVLNKVNREQALHSVVVICYSMAEAQRVRTAYPTVWIAVGVNTVDNLAQLEQHTLPKTGRLIALTPQVIQDTSFYNRLYRLGILCSVGTYGKGQLDEQPIREAAPGYRVILQRGGDILTTDRPNAVSKLFN